MYRFLELTEIEFLAFARTTTTFNYLQTAEMKKFREQRGAKGFYVGVQEGEQLVLASLIFSVSIRFGQKFEISGGPLGSFDNSEIFSVFTQGIKSFARAHNGIYVELEPDITYQMLDNNGNSISDKSEGIIKNFIQNGYRHSGFYKNYSNGLPRYWYVKDLLTVNSDTLISSYSKDGQYSLKKAKKFGITVRSLEYDELNSFKELTEAAAEHHDFKDKDLTYYQKFYKSFDKKADFLVAEINFDNYKRSLQTEIDKLKEKIETLTSSKKQKQRTELMSQMEAHQKRLHEANELSVGVSGNVILSGGLFIYNSRETVYLFSGTIERYRNLYAPYLIQDEMMRRSLKRGIMRYNFLGVQGIFDGSDGVLHFKESFNGYIEEKIGRFTLVTLPWKYNLTQILKKTFRR